MIRYSHKGTNPKGYSKKANPINSKMNHQILLRPSDQRTDHTENTDDTETIQSGKIRKTEHTTIRIHPSDKSRQDDQTSAYIKKSDKTSIITDPKSKKDPSKSGQMLKGNRRFRRN